MRLALLCLLSAPVGAAELLGLSDMPGEPLNFTPTSRMADQGRLSDLMLPAERPNLLAADETSVSDDTPSDAASATTPAPLTDDSVENVIHFLRFVFDGSNPTATAEPKAITALLLKDGRVFESEPNALANFDPAARPPGSAGTGRWQRDGEAYAIAFADGTQGTAVAKAAKTYAAPAALLLAGAYVATGGSASEILPDRLRFFEDGSVMLLGGNGAARTGSYRIAKRTIEIDDGAGARHAFLFGLQGVREKPDVLIVANRIYEREDLASPGDAVRSKPSETPATTSSIP